MEAEVKHRSSSQNKQNIEMANVDFPPARHNEKRLSNKEAQKSSSVLNQHNNNDEWQCPDCSQKERRLQDMKKNQLSNINAQEGEQMRERESQHSLAAPPSYNTDSRMSSPKTKPQPIGVTLKKSDDLHADFVLKVDCFTTLLLAITIGIISGLTYWNVFQGCQQKNMSFWITFLPANFALPLIIACCENNCKKFPLNLILPLMLILAESLLLGAITSFFAATTLMQVGGITASVTLVLYWFVLKSKWNIIRAPVPSWIVFSMLIIFGSLCCFNKSPTLQFVYGLFGMLSSAIHLIKKIQIRIKRESTKEQKPMDYTISALKIYTGIVLFFFFMLQLMEPVNCLD
ncbi:protein lifeguard 2 [Pelodiscus sinensis]|uniref:protein lifeguard 2 n=1 Tax=Pelodiscus sinensis TaxID=13735 RepID=UPI003F6CA212